MQIAIDGPAGVGKSTVAKALAEKLGITYLDTGAMYRAVTMAAIQGGIPPEESPALRKLLQAIHIEFPPADNGQRVLLNGQDVSADIRSPMVSEEVSAYASLPSVRRDMTQRQQEMAKNRSVIMDGRDIGTVILPQAAHKFFLVATPEERARRRAKDLEKLGVEVDLKQLAEDIRNRDRKDATRELSPLCKAEDAIEIDTECLSEKQVMENILQYIAK